MKKPLLLRSHQFQERFHTWLSNQPTHSGCRWFFESPLSGNLACINVWCNVLQRWRFQQGGKTPQRGWWLFSCHLEKRPRIPFVESRCLLSFPFITMNSTNMGGTPRWMARDGFCLILNAKWLEMTREAGDTIWSEDCQVWSGRSGRRCFGGRRGGRNHIAPVMKTGTFGTVWLSHLQCILWIREEFWNWRGKVLMEQQSQASFSTNFISSVSCGDGTEKWQEN